MNLIQQALYWLTRPLIKANVVADGHNQVEQTKPISYVLLNDSFLDRLALEQAIRKLGLPSPFTKLSLGDHLLQRTIGVNPSSSWFQSKQQHSQKTIKAGQKLLEQAEQQQLDVQFIPVMICWGRAPGVVKPSSRIGIKDLIADTLQPNWFRKLMIVLLSGRHNFIRLSPAVSLLEMANKHGTNTEAAHKLIRVARIHFERQRLVATGPKIQNRRAMFNALLASPAMKKALQEEMKIKKVSLEQAKKNALKLLDEIAGDYRETYIRMGDRILTWVWNKIYNGIRVHHAESLRQLAQKGHEIVYVPCHRSHMDYLLLTYVIYKEGLVPPHIAAGINLNFWPAGPIFRKAGAFFIRRSFKGNKLYSAVFREYLSQLFIKGYPVKFYTEGGRSRTGRLLTPKTGMLAMTYQAMLRGVDRPITLVPVYIGYEHVMEVNTYLKELKGKNKESESVFGVFKALKNLKNYGHGDVNFGQPIHLNDLLNKQDPKWRDLIDPEEVVKPTWLTPIVNSTAEHIMRNINDAAVLNTVNLSALALLTSENHALARSEMASIIQFYIELQRIAPYSGKVQLPTQTAEQIIDEAISLEKVEVDSDEYGSIIKLDDKNAILMSYYRNNVIHLYTLPSIIAAAIVDANYTEVEQIVAQVSAIKPMLDNELFLSVDNVEDYVQSVLSGFASLGIIEQQGQHIIAPERSSSGHILLAMLAKLSKDTLQRYALAFNRLIHTPGLSRSELESECEKLAIHLVKLHDLKAPEYFDKKLISGLVTVIKEQKLVDIDEGGKMTLNRQGEELNQQLVILLNTELLQSIQSLNH